MRYFRLVMLAPAMVPFVILFLTTSRSNHIFGDLNRWSQVYKNKDLEGYFSFFSAFYTFMATLPEFRSLFYFRVRTARAFSFLLKPMPTLFIHTNDIGPGLFIQHGFATIITAASIGKNCWINQQVTIGYSGKPGAPVIGDNVIINAGAIVIGGITIGDGAQVGAGSVVTKDVAANAVVAGVPARPIR